ncbi:hypothetical protein SEUCBS139899_010721 [Sporothrix eucalyptigena]
MLDQLRKSALELSESLTKDYIWQRDAFDLQLVSRKGLLYLHGQSCYGDCVEDEWLIVYMLRQLTKSFPSAWARICDNDGEFLLIEGTKAVPSWITPEIDTNRVWIHDGQLKIVPLEAMQAAGVDLSVRQASLTLADAVRIIRTSPNSLVHLQSLENEVFRRLQKYPDHVTTSVHYARLILPRKIAYLLHSRPRAVAPAIEAFISRDPLTTKRVVDSAVSEVQLQFPPNDLVVVSVKEKLEVMVELSMKLTFGFEIMGSSAETSNSRVVREVGLLLKDLAEDGDDPEALPSNLEISAWPGVDRESDDSWLNINFEDFERELDGGSNQTQSGPQATRYTASGSNNPERESGFGDSNVQADLRRIVSQFQAFLNDNDAGIDGADFGEMDRDNDSVGEDEEDEDGASEISEGPEDEVSFDEEEFAPELKGYGALRLNPPKSGKESKPTAARNITAGDDGRSDSADSGSESDDEGELDVDFNLAKNLLESFKGQEGMSGPAGNILGMLGLILPRDEDDDEKIDE